MSVGFRPTPEDTEIIRAHQRPDESTSDVLRRALRALDRERWEQEARSDMERIAADGEDLADEPDEWGYDDTGTAVDLRATQGSSRLDFQSWSEMRLGNSRAAVPSSPLRKDTFSPLLRRLTSQSPLAGVAGGNVMHAFKLQPPIYWNECALHTPEESAALALAALTAAGLPNEDRPAVRKVASGDRHAAAWKLAHLRAAARRRADKR